MRGSNPLNDIPINKRKCGDNSYVKDLVFVLAPSLWGGETAEVSPALLAASPYQPIGAGQSSFLWKDPIRLLPALGCTAEPQDHPLQPAARRTMLLAGDACRARPAPIPDILEELAGGVGLAPVLGRSYRTRTYGNYYKSRQRWQLVPPASSYSCNLVGFGRKIKLPASFPSLRSGKV
eukprot:Gb_27036 [translate_table: standard]